MAKKDPEGSGKNQDNGKSQESGKERFLDKVLRPWKTQRVTLTRAGKKRAPLWRGKGPNQAAKGPEGVLSPQKRTIKELKTLLAIGKRDPERLAGIVSRMLHEEREQELNAKRAFERLVWEKAEQKRSRDEPSDNGQF